MNQVLVAVLAIAALLAVTACSETGASHPAWQGDDAAWLACDDLARYAADGQPIADRQQRLDDVNRWAHRSNTERIAEQGAAVAQAAVGPPQGLALAMDVLSATCLDLGYAETR